MNVEQKINKANDLKRQIIYLESFINLIEQGQKYNDEYETQNEFKSISLSARIWTGSQTCDYERKIKDFEIIKLFVNAGVEKIKSILLDKNEELIKMFN